MADFRATSIERLLGIVGLVKCDLFVTAVEELRAARRAGLDVDDALRVCHPFRHGTAVPESVRRQVLELLEGVILNLRTDS